MVHYSENGIPTVTACRKCKDPVKKKHGKTEEHHSGISHGGMDIIVVCPMVRFGIDIVGSLPRRTIDNLWVIVSPNRNVFANTFGNSIMDEILCLFGVSLNLHSDQGFNSGSNTMYISFLVFYDLTRRFTEH